MKPDQIRKEVSKMKRKNKGIIAGLIITMSFGMMAVTGCSAKTEPSAAVEQVMAGCDWDRVNSALEKYDFGKTFYLDQDYQDEERSFDSVSIVNYDPESVMAFKEVPCQIMISYGRTTELKAGGKDYPSPMISINLVDNKTNKSYTAVYSVDGKLSEEEGEWVIEEDKDSKLGSLLEEANKMFGLEEL